MAIPILFYFNWPPRAFEAARPSQQQCDVVVELQALQLYNSGEVLHLLNVYLILFAVICWLSFLFAVICWLSSSISHSCPFPLLSSSYAPYKYNLKLSQPLLSYWTSLPVRWGLILLLFTPPSSLSLVLALCASKDYPFNMP